MVSSSASLPYVYLRMFVLCLKVETGPGVLMPDHVLLISRHFDIFS